MTFKNEMENLPDKPSGQSKRQNANTDSDRGRKSVGIFDTMILSVSQINDAKFRGVLIQSVLGAILVFLVLWGASFYVMTWIDWSALPLIGFLFDWFAGFALFSVVAGILVVVAIIMVTFFLFPAVMVGIMGFFTERVCAAVESKYYPDYGPARDQTTSEILTNMLKFVLFILLINLILLPIHILLFFIPPFNLIFFYGVNGYLLGCEFYQQAALRRLSPKQARALRRENFFKIFLCGIIIAIAMTIPLLNLFTPVLASAMMTHIFYNLPNLSDWIMPKVGLKGTRP